VPAKGRGLVLGTNPVEKVASAGERASLTANHGSLDDLGQAPTRRHYSKAGQPGNPH